MDANHQISRFEQGDWLVRVFMTWDPIERCLAGRAELHLDGVFKCRIALAKGFGSEDEANRSLARRAKRFIEDWEQREHNADSEFSDL